MNTDLTKGPVVKSMLLFAIPMILGDLLQQYVWVVVHSFLLDLDKEIKKD